jgi:hypothetical protein
MTPERLAEIRESENATRPGPWTLHDALEGDGFPGNLWTVATDESTEEGYEVVISIGDRAVGAFIEMARTAIPELLAYVKELRTESAARLALLEQAADDGNAAVDQRDQALAERDQARDTASRAYHLWLSPTVRNLVGKNDEIASKTAEALGLPALPGWLTDTLEEQP